MKKKNYLKNESVEKSCQVLRQNLLNLMTPESYFAVFNVNPVQYFLDRAINEILKSTDTDLLNQYLKMVSSLETNQGDKRSMERYATSDLGWLFYTKVYNQDHPEAWSRFFIDFDKKYDK